MSADNSDIAEQKGSPENEHPPTSNPPDSTMSNEPTALQESNPTTETGTATAETAASSATATTAAAVTTTATATTETSNPPAAATSHPNPTSHPPPPPPPPPHPSYEGQPPPPGPYAPYYGYGHPPPPHIPPPGYEGQPPHGITTEGGHRAPGPYTTAQYDPAKMAAGRGGNQGGAPPPLYHGSHAGPPHGGHTRSPSGSSPPHAVAHNRDPPPPPHYPPPPMHGPPPDHARPSPPGAYPPYRDAHHPHWAAHPDYAAAGHPPPPPRYYDASQPPPSYPPPPAPGYSQQPPAGMEHGHPGPYRYSDPTLRRQAVESRSMLGAAERYSDVDGREGATSPSQIESSHREEVTSMGCTCKKTKCLKLYCQCFAVKIYCGGNCRCLICQNTVKFEKERKDAIRNILSRNPSAFDTKFKKTLDGRPAPDRPVVDTSRVLAHKLGCKCRKSACMKKYCECYAGNVKCSANCRCVGCKNMPPGGLGPTSGPTGGPILSQTASVGSSEGDAHHAVPKPTKRREPWMMNAAQNLAFLKHSSPATKPSRPGGSHDVGDVASMPSLASEVSPADSKFEEETKTVSAAGASKIPEPTSSEKTAVNALLMAAMAMTEMGSNEATAPKSDTTMSDADQNPPNASYQTPPKAQVKRETDDDPDRAQTTSDEINQESRPTVSPTVASEDEDSPKRDLPDSTPCNQQKVKRSRIGSHRKGPRNLGEEMNDGAPPDEKMSPAHVYSNYNGGNPIVETPDTKIRGKKEEITPVSARCIDFRRMNVTGAKDQTD